MEITTPGSRCSLMWQSMVVSFTPQSRSHSKTTIALWGCRHLLTIPKRFQEISKKGKSYEPGKGNMVFTSENRQRGISQNGGTPNSWIVYKGKSYPNGWFRATPICGNPPNHSTSIWSDHLKAPVAAPCYLPPRRARGRASAGPPESLGPPIQPFPSLSFGQCWWSSQLHPILMITGKSEKIDLN